MATYLDVDFGAAFAGISTVGYRVVGSDGGVLVARTTSGVFEVGQGKYGVLADLPADAVGTVVWDTEDGGPVSASERIDLTQAAAFADVILRRRVSAAEASENGDPLGLDSLYGMIQMAQQSNTEDHPGFITVYQTDGETELGRKELSTDTDAEPVTGVS